MLDFSPLLLGASSAKPPEEAEKALRDYRTLISLLPDLSLPDLYWMYNRELRTIQRSSVLRRLEERMKALLLEAFNRHLHELNKDL